MPMDPITLGNEFLSGMEAHYGVASENPGACEDAGGLATYILSNVINGGTVFSTSGLTGVAAAAAMGTSDVNVIAFMNGLMAYIMTKLNGTAILAGITPPGPIAEDAFQAGVATYGKPLEDEGPLRVLSTAVINTCNSIQITVVTVPPAPPTIVNIA